MLITAVLNRPVPPPALYQSPWLVIATLVFLISIAGFLYNRRRKVRNDAKLRTRIASDLHDEVGSMLTAIALQADMLVNEQGVNRAYLQQIAATSREAIITMGDIIWSIDARNDNTNELLMRMRKYLVYMLELKGVEIEFNTADYYPFVPQLIRQNIYLIFKEAINNISKHAYANKVKVSIFSKNRYLTLIISDDGCGIPTHIQTAGQGLNNMKMRALRMSASFHISANNPGTLITLDVPLRK